MSPAEAFAMLTKLPTVAAEPIGDASSSRLLIGLVIGLLILGVALLVLAWWVARTTRYQPEALAPLEVMGTRAWLDADDDVKVELLELARPPSPSEPESKGERPTSVDEKSEDKINNADQPGTGVEGDKAAKGLDEVELAVGTVGDQSATAAQNKGKSDVRLAGAAATTPKSDVAAKGPSVAGAIGSSDATPPGIEAELTRQRSQEPNRAKAVASDTSRRPPTAKSITDSITTGPKRSSSARQAAASAEPGLTSDPEKPAASTAAPPADGSAQTSTADTAPRSDRRSTPDPGRGEKSQERVKPQAVAETASPAKAPAAPRRPESGGQAVSQPVGQPAPPARPSQAGGPPRPDQPDRPRGPAPPRPPRPAPQQSAAQGPQRKPVARPEPGSPEVVVVEQSPVAEVVVIDTAPDSAKAAAKPPPPPPPRPAATKSPSDKPDKPDKPAGSTSSPIPGEPIL